MKNKEQIISEMRAVMPFYLHPNLEPYIIEAMDVYAREYVKSIQLSDEEIERSSETFSLDYSEGMKDYRTQILNKL